jgi:hypothetical protein
MNERQLKVGLNVATSAIATEHFFSFLLSSPASSAKFLTPQEVRFYFALATVVSVGFSALMSAILENPYGIYTALGIAALGLYAYMPALG